MTRIPNVSQHAIDQAAARLGRHLAPDEWAGVILSIVERRAALLSRQHPHREIWLAPCGPLTVRVVWAPATAFIVTVLPDDTPATYAGSARAAKGRVRVSLKEAPDWFHRGKVRRHRTTWQREDAP